MANDVIGGEGGQRRNRRDRWREWPTTQLTHLVLRVANEAIDRRFMERVAIVKNRRPKQQYSLSILYILYKTDIH